MNIQKHLFLLFAILVFTAGGYVYAKESMKLIERFEEGDEDEGEYATEPVIIYLSRYVDQNKRRTIVIQLKRT